MNQKTYQELKDGDSKSNYQKIKQGGNYDKRICGKF